MFLFSYIYVTTLWYVSPKLPKAYLSMNYLWLFLIYYMNFIYSRRMSAMKSFDFPIFSFNNKVNSSKATDIHKEWAYLPQLRHFISLHLNAFFGQCGFAHNFYIFLPWGQCMLGSSFFKVCNFESNYSSVNYFFYYIYFMLVLLLSI